MKKVFANLVLLLLLQVACLAQVMAQSPAAASGNFASDQPIEVSADRLEGNQQLGNAKFYGNVIVQQGDVTLYAQELSIYYKAASRDIEKIVALNGVRIVQGERVATADQAVYSPKKGSIVLSGSPKVHQGQDFVQGDEITVFLTDERSVVTGKEGGRVNAVFHPQGDKP